MAGGMGGAAGPPMSLAPSGFAAGSPVKPGFRNQVRVNAQMPQASKLPVGNDATKAVWWERDVKTVTVPRNIVERLRGVHLAQLDELTRLRIQVAEARNWPLALNLLQERVETARKHDSQLAEQAAVARDEIGHLHKTISDLRYELVEQETQLRTQEVREVQLEERFQKRALRATESELGAVMQLELTVVGISLDELREMELVRLVTRPLREAAKQCLGLERAETSTCIAEQRNRLAIHLRLPPELRSSAERFRVFKKRFVEAKKKGELRVRLEESLVDLEHEFGARINVQSVSQPILLDGARIIVPVGAGALGMVPEGHPPGLVTLWQVQPGSWAQKMSIQSGDTLLWLNEQPVTEIDVNLLAERIRSRRPLIMYIVHPPGPATLKAQEEVAARRIQAAIRKKLLRDKARDERRRMKLASTHWEQEERAQATLEAKRLAAQAAQAEKRAQELTDNRQRMAAAAEQEEKDKTVQERREALRREYQQNLPKEDAERRAERERLRQEQAAVTLQAGWRGVSARADVQYVRKGKEAARQLQDVEGMDDLLADLGDYMDSQLSTWDVVVHDKKIGLKTAGIPPEEAVYVSDVTTGGWASQNGICIGDQLLQVGGKPVTSMSASTFYKQLKERPCYLQYGREEDENYETNQAMQHAAATKLQANWRGTLGRKEADMKQQALAQDQRLAEQSMAQRTEAARRGQGPRSAKDRHRDDSGRWIEVTVEPTTMNMGWMPEGMAPGQMLVSAVSARTWAFRQDIRVGDELVAVAGKDVSGMDAKTCKRALKQRPVQLLFFRDESQHLKATAEENIPRLGFVPDSTDPPQPVLVATVEPESWASRAGLAVGDTLLEIDQKHVPKMTPLDLQAALKKRPITLVFKREGGMQFQTTGAEFTIVAEEENKKLGFIPGSMPPDEVFVSVVEDGGWAAMHGVEENDTLVAVNGGRADTMKKKDFINVMKARPLRLTFRHARDAPHASHASGGSRDRGSHIKAKETDRMGMASAPAGDGSLFELVAEHDAAQLGLTPSAMPPGPIYVHMTEPGLWAAKNGVAINDQLLEIGGHKIDDLSVREFTKLMKNRPLVMLFQRGDGGPRLTDWPGDSPDVAREKKKEKKDKKEKKKEKEEAAEEEGGGLFGLGDMLGVAAEGDDGVAEVPEEKVQKKAKKEKKEERGDKKDKKEKKKKQEEEQADDDWGEQEEAPQETPKMGMQTWELVAYEEDEYLGFAPSSMPPDPVYVESVEPDTWAAYNEITVGDQVVIVNNVEVANMTKKEMKTAMKERPLYITIARESADGGGGGGGFGGDLDVPVPPEEEEPKKKKKKEKKAKKEKKEDDDLFGGLFGGAGGGGATAEEPRRRRGQRISGTAQEGDTELGFGVEGIPPDPVTITTIENYGWAEQAGFQEGDIIVEVNGMSVSDMKKKDMKNAMKDRPLDMVVERG